MHLRPFAVEHPPNTPYSLGDRNDDVRSVAASCLLPVAGHLVTQLPEKLSRVLAVLWSCLRGMRDDLSSSVGAVMELLGKGKLLTLPLHHSLNAHLQGSWSSTTKSSQFWVTKLNRTCRHHETDFSLSLLQRTFIRPITYPIPFLPSHHWWRKAGRRQYSSLVYDCPYIV